MCVGAVFQRNARGPPHCTVRGPERKKCHVTRLFEPYWPALCSEGPAHIPLEHGAYARFRPFLDYFSYEGVVMRLYLRSYTDVE